MARICIVSRNAPAANPRAVKEAQALLEAGHEVSLVHGLYGDWSQPLNRGALPAGCRSIGVPFGPGAPPTRRAVQLARRTFFRSAASRREIKEAVAFRAYGDASPDLYAEARKIQADLYIGHLTEGWAAAARAARANGVPFGLDAEDFHPGDRPDGPESAFENEMIAAIEKEHLPNCAYATAAAPGIADAYSNRYGVPRPAVVLNTFPKTKAPCAPTLAGMARPGPTLYWFSQTIGPNRGLECAVRAIARAKSSPHLHLRGEPSPGYLKTLMTLAREVNVADRLHILPPAPPDQMVALAAFYDAGLVGEVGLTHNRRIALTNKQFTYLLAGIPTLMSDIPAHVEFAPSAKGAVFLYRNGDPDSLGQEIDQLMQDLNKLAFIRTRAFELGQTRFNWETDRCTFIEQVENVL